MFSRFLNGASTPNAPTNSISHVPDAVAVRKPRRTQGKPSLAPTTDQSGVSSALVANRKRSGPVMDVDRETMAGALVELVVEGEYPPGYMLRFTELRKVYREMCQQNGWRERGWVSVARHFDLITTGGEKPYAYFYDEEGRARRLRVYPISRDKPRAALKVA